MGTGALLRADLPARQTDGYAGKRRTPVLRGGQTRYDDQGGTSADVRGMGRVPKESPHGNKTRRVIRIEKPASKRYVRDGPPTAVLEILDALGLTPSWNDACVDGAHTFVVKGEETRFESVVCETCGNGQAVLSWLGHHVPIKDDLK